MRNLTVASTLVVALALSSGTVLASDVKGSHSGHQMKSVKGHKEAVAVGVINSIDADGGKINVTHEPVPALGWPTMTMDLPVTRRVDLSKFKPGAKINFTLKQGRDKQFRVMAIEPKK